MGIKRDVREWWCESDAYSYFGRPGLLVSLINEPELSKVHVQAGPLTLTYDHFSLFTHTYCLFLIDTNLNITLIQTFGNCGNYHNAFAFCTIYSNWIWRTIKVRIIWCKTALLPICTGFLSICAFSFHTCMSLFLICVGCLSVCKRTLSCVTALFADLPKKNYILNSYANPFSLGSPVSRWTPQVVVVGPRWDLYRSNFCLCVFSVWVM